MATDPNTNTPDADLPADGPFVVKRHRGGLGTVVYFSIVFLALSDGMLSWPRHTERLYFALIGAGIGLLDYWYRTNRPWAIISRDGLACPWCFSGTIPWRLVRSCERRTILKTPAISFDVDPRAYEVIRRSPWVIQIVRRNKVGVPVARMSIDDADKLLAFCAARIAEAGD